MKIIDPFTDMAPDEVRRRLSDKKFGRFNELRVIYAIETLKPWWYMELCEADYCEDRKGIDLWIRHKVIGWVRFQVKSSIKGLKRHRRKGRKMARVAIPGVVSNMDTSLSDIIRQLEDGFRTERREGLFAERRKAFNKLKR